MRSGSETHPRPGVPRGICARDMRPVPDPVFHVEHAEEPATWAYTSRGVAGQTSSQPSQPSRPTPTSYSSRALPSGPAQTLARVVCGLASPEAFPGQIASRSSGRRCPQITSSRHAGCAPVSSSRPSGAPASPQPARELAGRSVASAARSRLRFRQRSQRPSADRRNGPAPVAARALVHASQDAIGSSHVGKPIRSSRARSVARCGCSTWNSTGAGAQNGDCAPKQRVHVRTAGAWQARRRDAGTGQGTGE
jgi:hypothetical protein